MDLYLWSVFSPRAELSLIHKAGVMSRSDGGGKVSVSVICACCWCKAARSRTCGRKQIKTGSFESRQKKTPHGPQTLQCARAYLPNNSKFLATAALILQPSVIALECHVAGCVGVGGKLHFPSCGSLRK